MGGGGGVLIAKKCHRVHYSLVCNTETDAIVKMLEIEKQ